MKTIVIQQTIRPEPAQIVNFRGTLEKYWTTHQGKAIRAQYFTSQSRGQITDGDGRPKFDGYSDKEQDGAPVVVRFLGGTDGEADTIIEVRDADTGEIISAGIWVDDETDLNIAGCFCSQDEQARAVAEVRSDV